MDGSSENDTLWHALDAAAEEIRHMALELARHDQVALSARQLVAAWKDGLMSTEHVIALERTLNELSN